MTKATKGLFKHAAKVIDFNRAFNRGRLNIKVHKGHPQVLGWIVKCKAQILRSVETSQTAYFEASLCEFLKYASKDGAMGGT